jgi:hypothetical protein
MIRLGKSSEIHRVSRVCRNADVAMAQTQQSVHERTDPVVAEQINSGTELIRIDSCAGEEVTPVIVRARDVGRQRNPVSETANALRPVRQEKRRVSRSRYCASSPSRNASTYRVQPAIDGILEIVGWLTHRRAGTKSARVQRLHAPGGCGLAPRYQAAICV